MAIWKVRVVSTYCKSQEYLVEADTDLEASSKWERQKPDSESNLVFTEDEVVSIELQEKEE